MWNPDRFFTWCAVYTGCLFHVAALVSAVCLVVMAAVAFRVSAGEGAAQHGSHAMRVLIVAVLLNIISLVHECGHGLALHRYGGHVREVGVRFVLGWPCWYCDITESYLLPRLRQRVAVIIAGPLFQAVTCAGIILAAGGTDPSAVVVRNTAAVLGLLTLVNFIPFLRSDGYFLLTEVVGMPNLRTHAWEWLLSRVSRQRMRAELPSRQCGVIAAYAAMSAVFIGLVVVRAITTIARALAGQARFSFGTVVAVLSLIVIARTMVRDRSVSA